MTLLFPALMLMVPLVSPLHLTQGADPPLTDLLTERELREYQRKPRYRDRINLFREVFDRRVDLLQRYIQRDQLDEMADLLQKISALSHYAGEQSSNAKNDKDLRSSEVKKLEIRLRKLIETINDLRTTVPFEYVEGFENTLRTLGQLRKTLLRQLLGEALVGNRTAPAKGTGDLASFSFHPGGFSLAAPPARLQSRDRFTEEEYGKLQLHQELEKRVEVFLEIAEARLEEIQRRMKGGEWEEEKENPLEFYTYWDMVHAYRRAIDGILINIDEKAIYKTASEKDIRKSLEKLNKMIQVFIPQLEPIKQLAIDRKDESLYRELEEAQEISVVAQKGSLYGLGAPAQ
ncbi:MAG: hypothetical protein E2P08_05325 [Acidobacteria bacterium]|nr:MAG: hypothetical protein E2P08_05325 [Acidobacteriota bacterium]